MMALMMMPLTRLLRRSARVAFFAVWACLVACGDGEVSEPAAPPPAQMQNTPDFSATNAYLHCAALCALGPRPTGSAAFAAQLDYLEKHLRAAGWRVQRDSFSPFPGTQMVNLRACFGASDSPRPLLISCHIDTKGKGKDAILGADDGASGAAVLLELARILARKDELAAAVELVFFDGEESLGDHITEDDGLYGSRYDVARRGSSGLPRAMINLDMVGGAGKIIAVPVLDTDPDLCELYLSAVSELHLPEDRWSLYPGSYWDDHRPFMGLGVPTLNLIASFLGSSWWHTSRDNMSRISADSLGETGRVVLHLLEGLAHNTKHR